MHAPTATSHTCPASAPPQSLFTEQPHTSSLKQALPRGEVAHTPDLVEVQSAHLPWASHTRPPEQSLSAEQPQTPSFTKQVGADEAQSVVLVSEHSAHAPVGWQAGVVPPQSESLPQGPH
jgi:hypothetical protein